MTMTLRAAQQLVCSVCGSARNEEEQRNNSVVVTLFGANWLGIIRDGRCPLCLGVATYRPRTVRRRWLRHQQQLENER